MHLCFVLYKDVFMYWSNKIKSVDKKIQHIYNQKKFNTKVFKKEF